MGRRAQERGALAVLVEAPGWVTISAGATGSEELMFRKLQVSQARSSAGGLEMANPGTDSVSPRSEPLSHMQ